MEIQAERKELIAPTS